MTFIGTCIRLCYGVVWGLSVVLEGVVRVDFMAYAWLLLAFAEVWARVLF